MFSKQSIKFYTATICYKSQVGNDNSNKHIKDQNADTQHAQEYSKHEITKIPRHISVILSFYCSIEYYLLLFSSYKCVSFYR